MATSLGDLGNWMTNAYCEICECRISDLCLMPHLVGNGYCEDENNNPECEFDSGDCCGDLDNPGQKLLLALDYKLSTLKLQFLSHYFSLKC